MGSPVWTARGEACAFLYEVETGNVTEVLPEKQPRIRTGWSVGLRLGGAMRIRVAMRNGALGPR